MSLINYEPVINVGIATFKKMVFSLPGNRLCRTSSGQPVKLFPDTYSAVAQDNSFSIVNSNNISIVDNITSFYIIQEGENDFIEISDVEIGIDFHWQRCENQRFNGDFEFVLSAYGITAVNKIGLEYYIKGVISAEMNGDNHPELLKAHAVASRSWLMAQIAAKGKSTLKPIISESEHIVWYDKEDHTGFDVCADDHCQRYQGITRAYNKNVNRAVDSTRGQFEVYNNEICDCRFSKCCGGVSETFDNCWQPVKVPYLEKISDSEIPFTDNLQNEKAADKFINSSPEAFCNTDNRELLKTVLNTFDFEYKDFYRWTVEYSKKELSAIVNEKSGMDFGEIIDLIPVERGLSSRITKLKIVGTKKTLVVGKELEIRRLLSKSHLYSSAITFEKKSDSFVIHGAGWGHGVGMCQIGAAVMALKGYNYKEILNHYFPKGKISKLY